MDRPAAQTQGTGRRGDAQTAVRRARLHRALADLMRTALGDMDGARLHLRSILELVPNEYFDLCDDAVVTTTSDASHSSYQSAGPTCTSPMPTVYSGVLLIGQLSR